MSFRITEVDFSALLTDLLPLAKQHLRIDFEDDDPLVSQYLGNAIQVVEDVWGQRINLTKISWSPLINSVSYSYQIPVQPVSAFEVSSGGVVQPGYSLSFESKTGPVYLVKDDKTPWPSDTTVALEAGFGSVSDMPPSCIGPILRVTATLYEKRETITTPVILVPYWLNDLLVGNWVPRV